MTKWLRQIDLDEYVQYMEDSGLHGAVVVLEPSFDSDTLASCLKIPSAKKMVRKHLSVEFEILQRQAR